MTEGAMMRDGSQGWRGLCGKNFQPVHAEALSSHLQSVCGQFEVRPARGRKGRVLGGVERLRAAQFETAVVSLDADVICRDARMIRQDPGENLFLLVQDEGASRIVQNGIASDLRPGDIYLADSTLPSEFRYSGSRQVSLHLPRDEAVRRLGRSCLGGRFLNRKDPLHSGLQAILLKIFESGAEGGAALHDAFYSLLGAYFHCEAAQAPAADRAGDHAYGAAVAMIGHHAGDPEFNVCVLAENLGLSRRTLQREFQRHGDTVSGRILACRLERARARIALLVEGQRGEASITTIAYDSGFNDLSYFYRTFRARYGRAPGGLLRATH